MDNLREQVTQIIKQWIIAQYPIGSETFSDLADTIIPLIRAAERERIVGLIGRLSPYCAVMRNNIPTIVPLSETTTWQALKEVK